MIFNNKTEFINLCAEETGCFHRISNYEQDLLAPNAENYKVCLLFKNTVDELLQRSIWNFAIIIPSYLTFVEPLTSPVYKEKWHYNDPLHPALRISNVRLNEKKVKDKQLLRKFNKTGAMIKNNQVYLQISTDKYAEGDEGRIAEILYADVTKEPPVAEWPAYFTELVKFDFTYKVTRNLYGGNLDDTKHFTELEARFRDAEKKDLKTSEIPVLSIDWYNK